MKELAADESVSEEARESAKKAFEVLMSSQLLDIEQAAALKKLESEAQFVNQQASIEQDAALEKLEAEAQFKRKKQHAERSSGIGLTKELVEWLERHRLQDYAADVTRIAGGCAS